MLNTKKIIPLILFFVVVFGSAYAWISKTNGLDFGVQTEVQEPTQKIEKIDTTQHFPLKNYSQNSYDELNTVYPMDTKQPENVKSVVEYDAKTGNYIFRTLVGTQEISTPYILFIAWDAAFARMGIWDFNPRYVTGVPIVNAKIDKNINE